jgi:hypothetical protein
VAVKLCKIFSRRRRWAWKPENKGFVENLIGRIA